MMSTSTMSATAAAMSSTVSLLVSKLFVMLWSTFFAMLFLVSIMFLVNEKNVGNALMVYDGERTKEWTNVLSTYFMSIFVLVPMIIMMMGSLLMAAFLAEVVVMLAWFVMSLLLLASLLVGRLFMEVTFSLIKSVDLNFSHFGLKIEQDNASPFITIFIEELLFFLELV